MGCVEVVRGDWKLSVMKKIGLTPISLSARDWALLLLYAGGQAPVRGEEHFHTTLFMMQCSPLSFKTLLLSVFSPELHEAIEELVVENLVERSHEREGGRFAEVYKLSQKGSLEARRLAETVKESWVLVDNIVTRQGKEILEELEALKKTYNGKGLVEWMRIFFEKLETPDNFIESRFSKGEVEYFKKLYKLYKSSIATFNAVKR